MFAILSIRKALQKLFTGIGATMLTAGLLLGIALTFALQSACNQEPLPDPLLGAWMPVQINRNIQPAQIGYWFYRDGTMCLYTDKCDPTAYKVCDIPYENNGDVLTMYGDTTIVWYYRFERGLLKVTNPAGTDVMYLKRDLLFK